MLLVHRPKYDDWSFPKGKLDPGEHEVTAAVREVAEETGLDVRLGPALTAQRYRMSNGRWKHVDYWTARVVGSDDVSGYRPNAEIDVVEWVPWEAAMTPARPIPTTARPSPRRGRCDGVRTRWWCCGTPRRARAGRWRKDDRLRPLRAARRGAGRSGSCRCSPPST